MSDLLENHIVGFPTRRLICFMSVLSPFDFMYGVWVVSGSLPSLIKKVISKCLDPKGNAACHLKC